RTLPPSSMRSPAESSDGCSHQSQVASHKSSRKSHKSSRKSSVSQVLSRVVSPQSSRKSSVVGSGSSLNDVGRCQGTRCPFRPLESALISSKSRRRRPWHDCRISSMSTLRALSVSLHHDGVAHQTSLRSRRTMMTRANSLHLREAGSLISLPVTHDHDPRKHPRTDE